MERQKKILVVDDEPEHCLVVSQALNSAGYQTVVAHDGPRAIDLVRKQRFDLHLLDIRMHPIDGLQVLQDIRSQRPEAQAIMLSAFADVDIAVKCMKLGAYDFLSKPINLGELLITVANALKSIELQHEVETLRTQLEIQQSPDQLLGESQAIQELLKTIEQIAHHNLTVMIRGESGTGKELTARALHTLSQRSQAPFVSVDCATLPETLVESELFGYERGAFTGANERKPGRLEMANGGTLFLDEIGNMSLALQAKLLRVLQERSLTRLGGKSAVPLDIRLITATNLDLKQSIAQGGFREDLYYRLNEFPLRLPPLRERGDDIATLAQFFLARFNAEFGKQVRDFAPATLACLRAYAWPGNVRELQAAVKRAVILAAGTVYPEHLPPEIGAGPGGRESGFTVRTPDAEIRPIKEVAREVVAQVERELILRALDRARGNKIKTARWLGIDYKTLFNKLKQYGIDGAPKGDPERAGAGAEGGPGVPAAAARVRAGGSES